MNNNVVDRNKKRRSVDVVVRDLRERILRGEYLCGEFLPPVRELTQCYGAANQTISAAFDALVEAGLCCRTGRGCQVTLEPSAPQHRPVLVLYQRPQLETHSLFAVLDGVNARLAELKLACRVVDTRHWLPSPEEAAASYSGVLMAMAPVDAGPGYVAELNARRIPNVVANLEMDWPVSATRIDRAATTVHAMRTMYDMGHRRIALLCRDPELYFYRQALAGYRQTLADLGLPFDENLVLVSPEYDLFAAFRTVRDALRGGVRFTGLVACRDMLAHAAAEAAAECGLEVGADLSIIGYDDLSWPCRERFLTTFAEPCRELGVAAVDMLYEQLLTGWREPEQKFLSAEFRLRRTLAPCREPAPERTLPAAAGARVLQTHCS